ncbi:hypothetical protein [Couchioplanes caeruleus]|uniref:Uncharacterized protein n=1 Tax=Couchioplanes caeruleus TaxID=56438 RepID=A0A3N1GTC8_9ACTN|nr:hypothetical protein [Couchioplanes caeruleus]ROP33497.1 hypothetical protein EDD30_6484 [Couchioplanes caeruleus]
MATDTQANLFIPMTFVGTLSVPALALTDGSAEPEWVGFPTSCGLLHTRRPPLSLPYDAATAPTARQFVRFRRMRQLLLVPVFTLLIIAGFVIGQLEETTNNTSSNTIQTILYLTAGALGWWVARMEKRTSVRPRPEPIGRLGIYISGVPAGVAQEWVHRNSAVQIVSQPPPWRRFSARTYALFSTLTAVAGAGLLILVTTDRNEGIHVIAFMAILALFAMTIAAAHRALPSSFGRRGRNRG